MGRHAIEHGDPHRRKLRPNFGAKAFFPDWNPEVVRQHGSWMVLHHDDEVSRRPQLSVHGRLLKLC